MHILHFEVNFEGFLKINFSQVIYHFESQEVMSSRLWIICELKLK